MMSGEQHQDLGFSAARRKNKTGLNCCGPLASNFTFHSGTLVERFCLLSI